MMVVLASTMLVRVELLITTIHTVVLITFAAIVASRAAIAPASMVIIIVSLLVWSARACWHSNLP